MQKYLNKNVKAIKKEIETARKKYKSGNGQVILHLFKAPRGRQIELFDKENVIYIFTWDITLMNIVTWAHRKFFLFLFFYGVI